MAKEELWAWKVSLYYKGFRNLSSVPLIDHQYIIVAAPDVQKALDMANKSGWIPKYEITHIDRLHPFFDEGMLNAKLST